jgi:hypothetical protein
LSILAFSLLILKETKPKWKKAEKENMVSQRPMWKGLPTELQAPSGAG